jgi:carbonic anhydrase/acetyltransferase-like protein (isoleucine patch superfamily)
MRLGNALVIGIFLLVGCGEGSPHNVRRSVTTDFCRQPKEPLIAPTAYVDEGATVIGSVEIGAHVYVGPGAFVRADEGQHMVIGDESNVQDCAGLHGLETEEHAHEGWHEVVGHSFKSDGARADEKTPEEQCYSVWLGRRVTVAHQALVHGPAWVGDDTFVGMQAQVFNAKVGAHSFIGPHSLVMGVDVGEGRLVPPGAIVTDQKAADALAPVAGSPFDGLNSAVIHVNTSLADEYRKTRE